MQQANRNIARLGDLVDLLTGFPFKSARYTENRDGTRLLRGDNIAQGKLRWNNAKRWPAEEMHEFSEYQLQPGDTVLAMDRPWIEAGLKYASFREEDVPALLVQRVARLRVGAQMDQRFLHYVIGSQAFTDHVLAVQTGTAVPHISGRQIQDFIFFLPPTNEQRAIASILSALDDKIALNRRMSETLEAMARALFKSWFVNFDPVHAKTEGRQPAQLDAVTAALFPDGFDDQGLPVGWRFRSIVELAQLNKTSVKPQEYPDEEFDHYSIPAFDVDRFPIVDKGEAIKSNKTLVPDDAILLSKLNPEFRRVWWPVGEQGRRLICSTEFLALTPSKEVPRSYLYSLLGSDEFATRYEVLVTGTSKSHQRVNPDALLAMDTVTPPSDLMEAYDEIADPFIAKVIAGQHENRILAELRDTLLPKFMSGQVRVRDAGR